MDKNLATPKQESTSPKSEFVEPRLTELGTLQDMTTGDPGFSPEIK